MLNFVPTEAEKYIQGCFSDLHFDEKRHLYHIVRNGVQHYLPSVSKLVDSHAPKFDAEKMLPFSASKQGVPVDHLREVWKRTNKEACDLGHRTHDFMEHYTGAQTPSSPQERAGIAFIKSVLPTHRITFRELRVYSEKNMYAGTMDLPLQEIEGNTYDIADYKTNGDLFKAYDMLYPPFNMMESSPYNKYQIQLSYYQIPLEDIGLRIKRRRLIHLREDGTFREYLLEDLTEHLRDYLKFKKKAA